ncbi:GtrA family protein [Luteococcus sp. Sow4_B9]|uniref:GtrA family protein n=1 Tax=Luteococcus sp. Sow4_B9 TaxID=3438792 RepID=UPI003F981C80
MNQSTESRRQRGKRNLRQFLTFGMVGGSGVVVNLAVVWLFEKLIPHYQGIAVDLPLTQFNVRWYHVFTVVAFMVANTWNYELNRRLTFKARGHGAAAWWRGLANFMGIGAVALMVGLVIQTALLKPESALYLQNFFGWMDDTTGLRKKLYYASLIQIVLTMPINFIVNKLWTFRAVRAGHPEDLPLIAPVVAPEVVDADGESALLAADGESALLAADGESALLAADGESGRTEAV